MRKTLILIMASTVGNARLGFADDIRDVKPPIQESSALVWIAVAVVLLGVGFLIYKKFSRKVQAPEETLTATQKALRRLNGLENPQQLAQARVEPFYSQLSDIVRRFIEEQHGIDAPEMTTEEFLNSAKTTAKMPEETKAALKEFLMSCDMVKFAKYQPGNKEVERSYLLAKNFIEQSQ